MITHGAGSNCNSPLLVAVAEAFAAAGYPALRCDLPYRQLKPTGPPIPGGSARDREGLRRAARFHARDRRQRDPRRPFLRGPSGDHARGRDIRKSPRCFCCSPILCIRRANRSSFAPRTLKSCARRRFLSTARETRLGRIDEMEAAIALIPARTKLVAIEKAGHELGARRSPGYTARNTMLNEFRANASGTTRTGRRTHPAGRGALGTPSFRRDAGGRHQEVSAPKSICEAYAHGSAVSAKITCRNSRRSTRSVATLEGAQFHLIGHLQSNKARVAAGLFQTDRNGRFRESSPAVWMRPRDRSRLLSKSMIEVKLSPEESKVGTPPERLPDLIAAIRELSERTI